MYRKSSALLTVLVASLTLTACQVTSPPVAKPTKPNSNSILVYYAGSMTKVMEQKIRPSFEKDQTTSFQGEGAGSSQLAQMIRSGVGRPDVFVSASPIVNNRILMGAQNHNLVNWYFTLARDQLVIAYSPSSRFKSQLEAASHGTTPWYQVLMSKGFLLGRTDPKLDPKGVSTLFMTQLASKYYHVPNLENAILGPIENPKQVFPEESLLAQLTSGQLDAVIAYKHEAVEWGVPYITLPNQVNLGDPQLSKWYQTATYTASNGKVQHGGPILFTITIPTNAANAGSAEKFVRYMISGTGHQELVKDGFTNTSTLLYGNQNDVPTGLKNLSQGTYKP